MEQWLNFLIVYYHLPLVQSLYMTLKAGILGRSIHMYLVGHCFGGFDAFVSGSLRTLVFSGSQFPASYELSIFSPALRRQTIVLRAECQPQNQVLKELY